jgi:hypothetical protein
LQTQLERKSEKKKSEDRVCVCEKKEIFTTFLKDFKSPLEVVTEKV